MIDALTAVIRLLEQDGDLMHLTAGRIAERQRFGMDVAAWPMPCKALQVGYGGGGLAELSLAWQRPRIEVTCFGESAVEAGKVYQALVAATRSILREVVNTSAGNALIYWLVADGGPLSGYDPDLGIDTITLALEAAVSEEAVS